MSFLVLLFGGGRGAFENANRTGEVASAFFFVYFFFFVLIRSELPQQLKGKRGEKAEIRSAVAVVAM